MEKCIPCIDLTSMRRSSTSSRVWKNSNNDRTYNPVLILHRIYRLEHLNGAPNKQQFRQTVSSCIQITSTKWTSTSNRVLPFNICNENPTLLYKFHIEFMGYNTLMSPLYKKQQWLNVPSYIDLTSAKVTSTSSRLLSLKL